jgi:DNA-binding winged helix-turn-helix (wHTH) protein/tetratricopeptide (TPR) repeat protein
VTEIALAEASPLVGRRWVFGSAVLDERSLELHVNGRQAEIERKSLEVLLYLLHHAGEVVTRDDLAENLWPGRVLTDTVLTRCISLLRQVLEDDERGLIRTVHGYGYRLVAQIKVETSAAPASPTLDFRVGDTPPTRPQWRLVERLGTGGYGEAWLARHIKTGDARVFKFAVDANALSSLKREITLYRLIRDSLGARAAVARILEWNLEEPPCFIEMEHVAGGNLETWSETQGGLAALPLAVRLDLAAQIAEAIAAAHSVGALHKDLKPGNVLVQVDNGSPLIRLCDFGSGTVLDPARLEGLGITRLGFTKTLTRDSGGTALYLAPEVIAGQPFTVQADIYALGILLYQIVAGDLRKALAPGWEADVEDELLREDIAAAAAGNPAKRLTDAAQLAERLRSLEQRRETRAVEVAARQRAERTRRIQEELRRTRALALVLCAAVAVAVAGWFVAYRAREAAVTANETARAVNSFLVEDVLSVDRTVERPQGDTYKAALERAAGKVDTRFVDQPQAAADVHWLLGRRFQEIEDIPAAIAQYEQATALFTQLYGATAPQTLLGKERLASIYVDHGRRAEAKAIADELRAYWIATARTDVEALLWRTRLARTLLLAGDVSASEADLRAVLPQIPQAHEGSGGDSPRLFKQWFGYTPANQGDMRDLLAAHTNDLLSAVLGEVGDDYREAEARAIDALSTFTRISGADSEQAAFVRMRLGAIRVHSGKYFEAEQDLLHTIDFYDRWLPAKHFHRGLPRFWLGKLRLGQERPADALAYFLAANETCTSTCPTRLKASYAGGIGDAHWQLRDLNKAAEAFQQAKALVTPLRALHLLPYEIPSISLATVLWEKGELETAHAVLNTVNLETVKAFPNHAAHADYLRITGLMAVRDGDVRSGIDAFKESHAILQRTLGASNWRTRRAKEELARAVGNK